jgi:hypothetical protein
MFIYCNYKLQYSVLQLLEALLKQLALHRRLTSNSIEVLHNKHKKQGSRPSLDTLATIFRDELEAYSHAFIVVDALDECFPERAGLDLLARLQSLTVTTPAKLMVTSRYIPSIESAILADVKLEITSMESDMISLVKARISEDKMLERLITKAPSMEEKVASVVVGKAQGMCVMADCFVYNSYDICRFLLARLHMDSLLDKSNRNAILRALGKLPEGFEATYDDALERINQQSPDRKRMAYRLLSWISYALRQLSFIELRYAVAVREDVSIMDEDYLDDEEFLISVCAGLVTISEESHPVGLVRESYIHIFIPTQSLQNQITRFRNILNALDTQIVYSCHLPISRSAAWRICLLTELRYYRKVRS